MNGLDPKPEECRRCRFWRRGTTGPKHTEKEHTWGECRIRSPQVIRGEEYPETHFPITQHDEGCGEFEVIP